MEVPPVCLALSKSVVGKPPILVHCKARPASVLRPAPVKIVNISQWFG
jgi:hypothetical protein